MNAYLRARRYRERSRGSREVVQRLSPGQEEVSTRFEEGHELRVGVVSDPFRMSISMSIVN